MAEFDLLGIHWDICDLWAICWVPVSVVGLGDALLLLYKSVLICHLAGSFLKHIPVSVAKPLGTLTISSFSSAGQQQQCQCTNSLMLQCSSSSAGLSGRIKTWEQQEILFHPSGKGRRWGDKTNPAASLQPGMGENAERQWEWGMLYGKQLGWNKQEPRSRKRGTEGVLNVRDEWGTGRAGHRGNAQCTSRDHLDERFVHAKNAKS